MEFKRSLASRIVIAFTLMTVLVAGGFGLGIVGTVYMVEEQLISDDLSGELDFLLRMQSPHDWRNQPIPGQWFYFSGGEGEGELAIPAELSTYGPGFYEVFSAEQSYHLLVRDEGERRYLLMQDQSDFEARERLLFWVVFCGFVICSLLSGQLGWLLARKVIEPLTRLAGQVRQREQLLTAALPLALDYADDEVGQLAAAFDDALGRLRAALARERLFTSDVSHELRTPLMVIASSCELLKASPNLNAKAREQVQRIARASDEMHDLAQTFLLLARAEHGRDLQAQKLPLKTVCDELAAVWRELIERQGLVFVYRCEQLPAGEFHAVFLRTVLVNLLRNALHYTRSGSISLSTREWGVVVEDSGVGIPAEEQEAVFQPFVRGSQMVEGGKGVGLSLIKRICALEGWGVHLQSVVPHGCRFEVLLRENDIYLTRR